MLESGAMKTAVLLAMAMFLVQIQPPRNDPNGTWEAETGTKFDLRLSGDDLRVNLVEGSNPVYVKYEVNLKNAGDVNTYKGAGYFVAKLKSGKECKFDTEWQIIVVQPEMIVGTTTSIVPDPDTCEVKERGDSMMILKKK
jgi:hypothetical protein